MRIALTVLTVFILQIGYAQRQITKDFKKHFEKHGVDGCFVLYNQADKEFIRYNSSHCDSAYLPASTFKIPNSLIALETGVVKDTSQIFKWNGEKWQVDNWNKDQTLKTAMKYSCIWVHIGIAKKLGIDKYRAYIHTFNYGNKDLSGPSDHFWLEGPFAISANQQVDFLRKFYSNKLGVSKRSTNIVKDIIVLESNKNYKLSGKTGSGTLSDSQEILWLVGYLEKNKKVYFYAMNFKTDNPNNLRQARYEITKDILRELKIME